MSDIKTFKVNGESVIQLEGTSVVMEKSLQVLIEKHLDVICGDANSGTGCARNSVNSDWFRDPPTTNSRTDHFGPRDYSGFHPSSADRVD